MGYIPNTIAHDSGCNHGSACTHATGCNHGPACTHATGCNHGPACTHATGCNHGNGLGNCKISIEQPNGFFDKNVQSPFHLGIRAWASWVMGMSGSDDFLLGAERAIGLVAEWHPLYGIGLQSGCMYSFFASVSLKKLEFMDAKAEMDAKNIPLDAFSTFTIPIYFRLYPGKERQFVLYIGYRWLLQRPPSIPDQLKGISTIGFEYNWKNGFSLGMHGAGIAIGYNIKV